MTTHEDENEFAPKRSRSHRDLFVWRKAIELAAESYRLAVTLPEENDGIGLRMHRASVSVAVNIAKGHGLPAKTFVRYLDRACGALARLMTLFELTTRLSYLDEKKLAKANLLADEVGRLLETLMNRLDARRWE